MPSSPVLTGVFPVTDKDRVSTRHEIQEHITRSNKCIMNKKKGSKQIRKQNMRTEETRPTKIWFKRNALWRYIYKQDTLMLDSKIYRYNIFTNYERSTQ